MEDVSLETFAQAHAEGAMVIDVREPEEYAAGHVPGALLMPMVDLPNRLQELPREGAIYVLCASGGRSSIMASLLARQGFDARSVSGGTSAWSKSGRRMIRGGTAQSA